MDDVTFVPMISVHPDRVNVYNEMVRHVPRRFERAKPMFIPKDKSHKNIVSSQATRKINKAVDYLIYMAADKQLPATSHGKSLNFKISFITLTLSSKQIHTDNEIKSQLLNQFLIEASKKWRVRNYIWRAEKQKNGNIHFHILCDRFIPWSELRDCWNRIQNKMGYVDRYREEMRSFHSGGFQVRSNLLKSWSYKAQIKAYKTGLANDWHNPNSTDIHSIKLVNNVKAYVVKYATKPEKNGDLQGRMWGCNYELTNIKGGTLVVDSFIANELRSAFRKVKPKFYSGEHFTVIYITPRQLAESGASEICKEFAYYLLKKFNYHFSLYVPGSG